MSKGFIYILTNPSFPQYVKIGYATDVKQRLDELNRSTAVPAFYFGQTGSGTALYGRSGWQASHPGVLCYDSGGCVFYS